MNFLITKQIQLITQLVLLPLFYTKRPNRIHMTRLKVVPKRKQFQQLNIVQRSSTLLSSPVQRPTLPNDSTVNTTPNYNIDDNIPVNNDTDSPIKVYSKTNYLFPHNLLKLK